MKKNIFLLLLSALLLIPSAGQAQKKVKPVKTQRETAISKDSLAAVTKRAEAGSVEDMMLLAGWYDKGKQVKQDYKLAFHWYAKAAEQNNGQAVANLARYYQFGYNVKADSAKAAGLYKKSLEFKYSDVLKYLEAQTKVDSLSVFSGLLLYDIYNKGVGEVKRDEEKARSYQEFAANGGHVESQYDLARYYLQKNKADKSAELFRKASEAGVVGATYFYGYQLFKGQGVAQDKKAGIEWMQKAADQHFTAANGQLGRIYYEGDGVEVDSAKAVANLKIAAGSRVNNSVRNEAQWWLAHCYMRGLGVERDYGLAMQWFAEVATKTSYKDKFKELITNSGADAVPDNNIFSAYLYGMKALLVDENIDEANKRFKVVEKAKNNEGTAMIAFCTASDKGKKPNVKKAIKSWTSIADKCAIASYYLGLSYAEGKGVDKDTKKALEYMQAASDKDFSYASLFVADAYMTGTGVSKDESKAAELYIEVERQHQLTPEAAKNLIKCYELKLAVLPDVANSTERIAELSKVKENENVVALLKTLP